MDKKLREAQFSVLKIFAKRAKVFALCGGTALELFYLKHRFSADLDFFSPNYDPKEIKDLITAFSNNLKAKIKLEAEFSRPGRAQVRFYTTSVRGTTRPLKIDFVEDILVKSPAIKKFNGLRVYSAKDIYLQKISAVTGIEVVTDEVSRALMQGRRQARDIFDIYMLSKKIMPLHRFLKGVSGRYQRGMVHWYRTFSRQQLKLDLLDLDIYIKSFNAHEMIIYLEGEIKQFIKEVMQ